MRINTNVSALQAYGNLSKVQGQVSESMAKLSSGFRINKAADDAAGLGIANKLRAENRALTQASKNAEQANSVLQIAEGATSTIQKMLERMKELATQAGSDSVDNGGRARIQSEFDALRDEITRTVDTTKFQGKELLKGGFGTTTSVAIDNTGGIVEGQNGVTKVSFDTAKFDSAQTDWKISQSSAGQITLSSTTGAVSQTVAFAADSTLNFDQLGVSITVGVGATADAFADTVANAATGKALDFTATSTASGGSFLVSSSGDYDGQDLVTLDAIDLQVTAQGAGTGLELTSLDLGLATSDPNYATLGSRAALTKIDQAIDTVNTVLGNIGAAQNRVSYAIENVKTTIQNFSAAESVIRDVDMAEEMTKFSKNNILAQAGTAMLAQANQAGQGVLQLLRG